MTICVQVVVPARFISSHILLARVVPRRSLAGLSDLITKVTLEAPPARGEKPRRWQSVVDTPVPRPAACQWAAASQKSGFVVAALTMPLVLESLPYLYAL